MTVTVCLVTAALVLAFCTASAFAQEGEGPKAPAPTYADVSYGSHERNVLDFWQAQSDEPTPLAIYIHGGGFTGGNKAGLVRQKGSIRLLNSLLDSGISVAAIHYRLVTQAPLPAAHYDGRRALQFLRSKSQEWNIDKNRVAAWGGSAGAQVCMYLAFHDEMADLKSEDPIARESTRLTCVATSGGQTTRDQELWLKWLPEYDKPHRDFYKDFDVKEKDVYLKAVAEVSALSLISADDPPLFMTYGMAPDDPVPEKNPRGWKVHHVIFGVKLKEKMDALGVESVLKYRGVKTPYRSPADFFIAKLIDK